MRLSTLGFLLLCLLSIDATYGFTNGVSMSTSMSGVGGGSSFVVSQRRSQHVVNAPIRRTSSGVTSLRMGGSMAKFGIFSPAVYAAKIVLGDQKLKQVRGKAISLHSQAIGDFCGWVGAQHLRVATIKLAKVNGDTLGFLV